jgi:hypothetical protein
VLASASAANEQFGRSAAAGPVAGVGIDDDDGAAGQQVAGDLREGRAGQPGAGRDLRPAQAPALAQDRQHALLVGTSDQRMYATGSGHAATVDSPQFFRQQSDIIISPNPVGKLLE